MNERTKAIVTLIVVILCLSLVLCITFGVINADDLTKAVTAVLAIASTIFAWWRNNNVTENAIKAQEYLETLKQEKDSVDTDTDVD